MKIQEKLIRKIAVDTMGSSSIMKKIASLVIFIFYFTIAVIILFISYDGIPDSIEKAKKYLWASIALSLIWYASKNTNFNINISYNINIFTYLMPLIFAILTSFFLFREYDNSPQKIMDYIYVIPLWASLVGVNVCWRFIMILSEKNTRPFFAKEQIFKAIIEVFTIVILLFAFKTFIPMLVIDKLNFINLIKNANTQMLFAVLSTGVIIIITTALIFAEHKASKQNDYISLRVKRTMSLYNSLLVLGPVAIWFLVKVHISNILLMEWVYIIAIISFAILCTLNAFSKGESGSTSKVYLLTSNTTLFIVVTLLFVMTVSTDLRFLFGLYFALPVIIYILILNIIVGPEIPPTYGAAYYGFVSILSFYLVTIWSAQILIEIWDTQIPFSIDKILWLVPTTIMVYLEILVVISTWHTYHSISKQSIKINKYQNKKRKKGVIRRKKEITHA